MYLADLVALLHSGTRTTHSCHMPCVTTRVLTPLINTDSAKQLTDKDVFLAPAGVFNCSTALIVVSTASDCVVVGAR